MGVPRTAECPIDNWLNDIAREISPMFKKVKFTPNGITTLSLLFGLLSAWFLYKGNVWVFAVLYVISYFFDCMDGLYARKYNMSSKFGDWYDHGKDIVVGIIIIVIVFFRYRKIYSVKSWIVIIAIFVAFTIPFVIFVECQSVKYKDSDSLKFGKKLCVGDPEKTIKWSRYFGPGMWTVFFVTLIIALEKKLFPNIK